MSTFVLHANDRNRGNVLANCLTFLQQLPDGKPWEVSVKPHVKKRSDRQNRALFGLAYPTISAETGFTVDELHTAFCKRFFGTVQRDVFGQMADKPFRTTTTDENGKRSVMSTADFARFYEMVQQVAAEAGVYVPSPEPSVQTQQPGITRQRNVGNLDATGVGKQVGLNRPRNEQQQAQHGARALDPQGARSIGKPGDEPERLVAA